MPKYMLSVFQDPDAPLPAPDEIEQVVAAVGAHQQEMKEAGAWVFFATLTSAESATVVSARGVDVSMTDGPYAEAKEQIGGFTIIEASDLDEALEWARKGSEACRGPVEVRPLMEGPPEPT